MKYLLLSVLALPSFAASARTLMINNNFHQSVRVELVADFGNGPETFQRLIFPQMNFATFNFTGDLKLIIETERGFKFCEGVDINASNNVQLYLQANGICSAYFAD